MPEFEKPQKNLRSTVRRMYNEHPFPNRQSTLPNRTDERFQFIYENFLHLPLVDLKGKVVLDAGCGTGENTWSWRRILHPTTNLIALDLSTASVQKASSRQYEAEQSPLFSVGSLLEIPLPDASVDLVFCSGVLVAVTEPQVAYDELVRVLKPGGYMVIILYHTYGRMVHGFRRAVVDLLEKEDIDRRAYLGGKIFGPSMRRQAKKEDVPLEGVLYDQFGLPCETRYSVGDALRWFERGGIDYRGSWPPVEWNQFGKAIRFSHFLSRFRNTFIFSLLLKIFPEPKTAPTRNPGIIDRFTMQLLWTFNQLQLFAISGRKR